MFRLLVTFSWPTLRVGQEKVARTRAKRKAGFFFVVHPLYIYNYTLYFLLYVAETRCLIFDIINVEYPQVTSFLLPIL